MVTVARNTIYRKMNMKESIIQALMRKKYLECEAEEITEIVILVVIDFLEKQLEEEI